ncbi:hypothetical protein LEP1GSC008_2254 [Leptospira kirschneri serovar Bulgarica str. Nikolaevo]|uniref:Uncharacterized protein n=1 Tax=Leptospira kirschneri serovar Bulgarica str. Nikolaevo TaxID=1240687 RepID=M6FDV4_9LEPT|nr:hypothetical protein LEP1GSC008_2254 [Leptospira kirschneri serovar Bulgarica str. Nikolaevo]
MFRSAYGIRRVPNFGGYANPKSELVYRRLFRIGAYPARF